MIYANVILTADEFFLADYPFKNFEYTLVHCNVLNLCFKVISILGKPRSEHFFSATRNSCIHGVYTPSPAICGWMGKSVFWGQIIWWEYNLDLKKCEKWEVMERILFLLVTAEVGEGRPRISSFSLESAEWSTQGTD